MKILYTLLISIIISPGIFSQEKTYTVGVQGIPLLPYSDYQNKKYTGALKDISEEFAKKQGVTFKYVALPIPRLYADFYNGKLDFKLPANPYWQSEIKTNRKIQIKYSEGILDYVDGIMIPKRNEGKPLKKIGIVAGFTPREYLEAIKKGKLKTSENPSILGLLQQSLLGRIDGVYINLAVGKYYLENELNRTGELIFASKQPHTKSTYHLATIKHSEIIKSFNLFLNSKNPQLLKTREEIKNKLK